MTNEQIIYLGPEEELTSVRERLEGAHAGRIMLVIPPQTQLRSHLGWRLLYSRMRELGKDVVVISSDRQIRTVAQNAGFRVADSKVADAAKESPASNKQRPASRPVGSDMGGKKIQRSRNQPDRSSTAHRIMRSKQPNQSQLAANNRQQAPQSRGETDSKISRADEAITASGAASSSTFETHDEQLTQPYESHIDTSPSILPLVPEQEDEELDPLREGVHIEDVYFAQHIREAAQSTDTGTVQSSEVRERSSDRPEQHSMLPPVAEMDEDLFAYMEDIQPVSLPEQRASTFIHELDPDIADISELPTELQEFKIDDLGDQGEIEVPHDLDAHSWTELALEEPYEEETPRVPGVRLRQSRMGGPARPSVEDFDDQDKLLPPEQPARVTPSSAALSAGAVAASTASRRQPKPQTQSRNVKVTPTQQQAKKPAATKTSRNVTVPPVSNPTPSIFSRRGSRIMIIAFISLVGIVLALLAFLYYGSNATVTITVPTESSSSTMSFEASTNVHDTQHNTIPSQVLTYTASATGQGTATGTVKQGNASATGFVIFTNNNGSKPLDIPTGTVVATSGGVPVKFVTTADALSGVPMPIQAENPGDSGNVAANTINIITPDGITKIAQNSGIAPTAVNLTVTNLNPTTGGGAANVPSVTSSDVTALEMTLHQQVQTQIKDWLAKVVHAKDVTGTLMPDVLGSSTLLKEEKLLTTPAVGQAAPNGKVNGVLTVTVSLLVIRDAAIQAAGRSQLNAAALKMKPAFVLATQRPVNVTVTKSSASPDGKTLSITVTASGQIMQRVSAKAISNLVAGKNVSQAKSDIMGGKAGINGVVETRIDIFPPLLGIMPFRPEQIHIIVQPGPSTGTSNG